MTTLAQLQAYLDPQRTPIRRSTMPNDVEMVQALREMSDAARAPLIRDYGPDELVRDWMHRADAMSAAGNRGGLTAEEHSLRFGIGFLRWLAARHAELLRRPVDEHGVAARGIDPTRIANWRSYYLNYFSSAHPRGLGLSVTLPSIRGRMSAHVAPLARWLLLRWMDLPAALATTGWNPNRTAGNSDYIDSFDVLAADGTPPATMTPPASLGPRERQRWNEATLAGERYFSGIVTSYATQLVSLGQEFERYLHGLMGTASSEVQVLRGRLNAWQTVNSHQVASLAGIPPLPGFPQHGLPYGRPLARPDIAGHSDRIQGMKDAFDYSQTHHNCLPVPSRGLSDDPIFQGRLNQAGVIMNRVGEGQPPHLAPWF